MFRQNRSSMMILWYSYLLRNIKLGLAVRGIFADYDYITFVYIVKGSMNHHNLEAPASLAASVSQPLELNFSTPSIQSAANVCNASVIDFSKVE